MHRTLIAVFAVFAFAAFADEPSPIEDHNFFVESGWNRTEGAMIYTNAFLGGALSHELAQEWAWTSPRHQFSYTIPIYSDGETGLGDAALHYRYQLFGGAGSKFAVAPRLSVLLPTRSEHFGGSSSGLQVNVPVSAKIGERLTSHTNVGATWFREREVREINLAQSLSLAVTDRLTVALDAAYTACQDDEHLFVVRPGVQFAFEGPRGLQLAPGIALPIGGQGGEGVLFYLAVEHPLR